MKKNIIHYLIAFILPILIFCFAMYSMNVYPFGNISLRISDALTQYPGFFEGLKHFTIFNFNLGLGENFYPTFTTYLNNPLNLLYFLFKKENFDLFFAMLILIKIGLIGLTMNILLNYKKKYNKKSILFSTIYALSGFVTIYYWNYQFLDAIYMLPLIMIGIDRIVNDNKNLLYFIFLTYMIFIHYYTAYMICLFSVIYFFFLLYNSTLEKEEKRQRIIKFFVTSLLSGLSAAVILLPTIFSMMQGRASYFSETKYFSLNYYGLASGIDSLKVPVVLYNFTTGSNYLRDNYGHWNFAPTYISLFVFILIILNLFDKKINLKYRKSLIVIILIYFVSIIFNSVYYVWHLFQEPIGLPSRFIFVFDAFFVLIAYNFYTNEYRQKNIKNKKILISVILFIIITFIYKNYI